MVGSASGVIRLRHRRRRFGRCPNSRLAAASAADFESLFEIVRKARRPFAAVTKIDAVLSGQASND